MGGASTATADAPVSVADDSLAASVVSAVMGSLREGGSVGVRSSEVIGR